MIIIVSFMIVFLTITAIIFSDSKTKSLYKLLSDIKELQKEDSNSYIKIKSNDEFELLADYYNKMIREIKRLVKQNITQSERSNISEIRKIEAQFNPHYMFNTLGMLKYMIKINPLNAEKIVIKMADLLRYSIRYEKEKIKLIEDLKYIEDYLKIQKYRFDNNLEYSINIDKRAEDCFVPKLIIQPLVENSIKFGYEKNGSIKLELTIAVANNKLFITLVDDSGGVEPNKLKLIKNMLKLKDNKTNHIGLHNIQRRIQLMFGNSYGLRLKNIEKKGLKVTVSLPYIY